MYLLYCQSHLDSLEKAKEFLAGSLVGALDQVTKNDPNLTVFDRIIL